MPLDTTTRDASTLKEIVHSDGPEAVEGWNEALLSMRPSEQKVSRTVRVRADTTVAPDGVRCPTESGLSARVR